MDFLPRIASDYARFVSDREIALQRDVDRARQNLRAPLGPVSLLPDVTGRSLSAEGQL